MADENLLEAIDADEAKAVVLQVLDFAATVAGMTSTPLDGKVNATVKSLVERPLIWNLVISMINRATAEGEMPEEDAAPAVAEEEAGIPITTVVTLITTLMPLIKAAIAFWKQRRDRPTPTPEVV